MSTINTGQQATVSVDVGANELRFETGKLAKQAGGAVVVRSGDTMILATAVGRQDARPDADFFPLTVDVEERMYAAGKIPGGFFKREGRATERATLTARMIDRPIRPLWPKGFKNEVQVICTVLSADMVVPHDILAINGASAALAISPLPFLGPVGAVRIGRIEGRVQAIIVGSNGTYMPGTFFQHLFKDYEHLVRQFQVVQHERGAIELKIVQGPRFEEEAFGELVATLRRFLGDDMRIDVVFVDRIAMVRTGKHQAAISHLPIDLQRDDVRLGSATGG